MLVFENVQNLTYYMSLEVTENEKDRIKNERKRKIGCIKELADHNGNKNRASKKFGLSRRQINRLIIIF